MEHIAPFWENLKDEEYGGFYGYMDFDRKVDRTYEKGCILNSRILWFFANAYLSFRKPEFLAMADHAYDFMMRYCRDREKGGVYWSVTYDGKVSDSTKHTYNQAFAVYALSSYYDASGNRESLEFARELFHLIESKCTDEIGYLESFDRNWEPEANDKLSENGLMADKTMNTLLHVLEAYTELYRVDPQEDTERALRKILKSFREDVYNSRTHRLEVFFDKNLHTLSDLYSYGHDIEASWLLDRAAVILGDPKVKEDTFTYTAELAGEVYANAIENGAMNNECFHGQVDTTRVWWVQAEAMVGFYNCWQKTKDPRYRKITEDLWSYIKTFIIDKREGSEWFWDLDISGRPVSRKPIVEPWKCPYHNGRMCMELIARLET